MLSLSEPIIKQETVSIVKANLKTASAIFNKRILSRKRVNFTEKKCKFYREVYIVQNKM